jgi:nucleotide-binding universal stress UspA family protein
MTPTSPRTIVVGIDGTDASLAALRFAMNQATTSAGDLDVVHCWHAANLRDIAFGSTHELQNASVCLLDNEVAAARRDTGCTVKVTTTSVHGRPVPTLVERSVTASLLVVGTHSHMTFRQSVLGTVATACRNRAACTVVVVGADGTSTWHHRSPLSAAAV